MKKYILIITLFFTSILQTQSQTTLKFNFTYDNNGNRIHRYLDPTPRKIDPNLNDKPFSDSNSNKTIAADIYPNPTQGILNIDITNLPTGKKFSISIYDTYNKLVYLSESYQANIVLNISDLSCGIYFIKIDSGSSDFKKIIMKE